jgi:hypothetical protein
VLSVEVPLAPVAGIFGSGVSITAPLVRADAICGKTVMSGAAMAQVAICFKNRRRSFTSTVSFLGKQLLSSAILFMSLSPYIFCQYAARANLLIGGFFRVLIGYINTQLTLCDFIQARKQHHPQ